MFLNNFEFSGPQLTISNEDIMYAQTLTMTIIEATERLILRWMGHILLRTLTSISKDALHWPPVGKSLRTMSKETWT